MPFDFLSPVSKEFSETIGELSSQHLGSKISTHTEDHFPEIEKIQIALICVPENRGSIIAVDNIAAVQSFRNNLYKMFPGNWEMSIGDLGDLSSGDTVNDTYFELQRIVVALLKRKIVTIVVGGSQDLSYPIYRSYDSLEQMVNMVAIDSRFDFGRENDDLSSNSYLTRIVADEPNNLFNYTNIGYQTYYNSQEEIDLLDKLFFDGYRLGEICKNIELAEPVLRDADFVSLDLESIKSADSNNQVVFSPNGLDGKEICTLSRYAGISDRTSCMGIFNTAGGSGEGVLMAQIIWYFLEGYHFRSNEYPFGAKENYLKYIVPFEDQELIFYKSNRTDRWWMEVSSFSAHSNKSNKTSLLPCSYDEYLTACNHELPERWWKFQRKSMM